jgi:ribosomal protein S18 acetylase RimI-like enzyme
MAGLPTNIRPATSADVGELAELHVASWHETYPGLIPAETLASQTVDSRRKIWTQIMADSAGIDGTVVYIAEHRGRMVGFVSCGPQRTATLRDRGYDGEISAIYLLQITQRRGVGRTLMSAAAADLARRGFGAASLWVLRENAVARGFYERLGAVLLELREDAHGVKVLVEIAYGWNRLSMLNPAVGDARPVTGGIP